MNLAYHIVHRYFPFHSRDEDMMQIALVGLCQAAESWDESKGSFNTYGGRCVRNAICNEIKYRKRDCRGGLAISLDQPLDEGLTLGDAIVGESDVAFVDLPSFYETLDQKEKDLFDAIYNGEPKWKIAERFGVSRQTIATYTRLLKKRMEEYYGT